MFQGERRYMRMRVINHFDLSRPLCKSRLRIEINGFDDFDEICNVILGSS